MQTSGPALHPGRINPGGKGCRYPLNRRMGGPQSRSVRFGEYINVFPLPGFEMRIIQPVCSSVQPADYGVPASDLRADIVKVMNSLASYGLQRRFLAMGIHCVGSAV